MLLHKKMFCFVLVVVFLSLCPIASAAGGQEKLDKVLHSLKTNANEELVFSEAEALGLVNTAAQVLFSGTPWVSASCSTVSFRNGRAEVNTVLKINSLHITPQVTFTVHVSGDHVVIDISRMRVGFLPLSVAATLASVNLAGPPDYMQIYPWRGRMIVEKRGSVVNVREIDVGNREVRLHLGSQ